MRTFSRQCPWVFIFSDFLVFSVKKRGKGFSDEFFYFMTGKSFEGLVYIQDISFIIYSIIFLTLTDTSPAELIFLSDCTIVEKVVYTTPKMNERIVIATSISSRVKPFWPFILHLDCHFSLIFILRQETARELRLTVGDKWSNITVNHYGVYWMNHKI